MEESRPICMEVTLIESCGSHGHAGCPLLYCRYCARHFSDTSGDGQITLVARDRATNAWREHGRPTTFDDASDVLIALEALGIPRRKPALKGRLDTSDSWTSILFHVRSEQGQVAFDIHMESSGFEGADAEPFRCLCRRLFAMAGFESYHSVVYGSA